MTHFLEKRHTETVGEANRARALTDDRIENLQIPAGI